MIIVQINATCGIGSTGKICVGISELMTTLNGTVNIRKQRLRIRL